MQLDGLRRRSFVVRYLTLFGGEACSKLSVLVAFAYLARVLGPRDFGTIELALSTTVFFVLGAETGLGSYGAGIIATSPERAPQLIARAGLLRGLLGLAGYVVMLGVSLTYGTAGAGILAIYGVTVLLTPFNIQWVFQGLRQMQWVAAGSLLRYGTFAALVLLIVRRGTDTRVVAMAEVTGALFLAAFNTAMLRRLQARLDWRGVWLGARDLFGKTWFLGASDLTWATMWYSPTIILGWFEIHRAEHVAWLAASVRIVMALHAFVWLYFFNMVPNLSKELHEGIESWRALVGRSLSVSMWVACFIALAGTLLAPVIIGTVFGPLYASAVWPFQIVIWMVPVSWLSGHFRYSLIVSGRQHLEFMAMALGGITTAVLAMAGARLYGAPGAAGALLAGGVVNALVAGLAMRRTIGTIRLNAAAVPLLICAMAILIGTTLGWALGRPAGAVIGCVFYAAVAATQRDLRRLRHAWEGQSL